jgi:hypothetical protein
MRPLDLAFACPVNERGRIVAQDRVGKKKETVECRPFSIVSLQATFELVEITLRPR